MANFCSWLQIQPSPIAHCPFIAQTGQPDSVSPRPFLNFLGLPELLEQD